MDNDNDDLETRVNKTRLQKTLTTVKDALLKEADSLVYGVQRVAFLTPMMYLTEIITGMENKASIISRGISAAVNLTVAKYYHKWFRPLVYKMFSVDENSSKLKKDLVNRTAFVMHQAPLYLGILWAAGADWKQIAVTLPTGLAVGAATAEKFQNFMDGVHEFIQNKLYLAEDRLVHYKDLSKKYAVNLAYAILISVAVKGAIQEIPKMEFKPAGKMEHPVLVSDYFYPDAVYYIDSCDMQKNHLLLRDEKNEYTLSGQMMVLPQAQE